MRMRHARGSGHAVSRRPALVRRAVLVVALVVAATLLLLSPDRATASPLVATGLLASA